MMGLPQYFQRLVHQYSSLLDHDHVVGKPLHLFQQVR